MNVWSDIERNFYSGVYVDQHLGWDVQVVFIVKLLKRLFHVFYYNLRNVQSNRILYRVYDELVGSVLRYAIVVWNGMFPLSYKKFGDCVKLHFKNHSWG